MQAVEAMNMIREGQVKRIARADLQGPAKFVASLFQIAAQVRLSSKPLGLKFNLCNGTGLLDESIDGREK